MNRSCIRSIHRALERLLASTSSYPHTYNMNIRITLVFSVNINRYTHVFHMNIRMVYAQLLSASSTLDVRMHIHITRVPQEYTCIIWICTYMSQMIYSKIERLSDSRREYARIYIIWIPHMDIHIWICMNPINPHVNLYVYLCITLHHTASHCNTLQHAIRTGICTRTTNHHMNIHACTYTIWISMHECI